MKTPGKVLFPFNVFFAGLLILNVQFVHSVCISQQQVRVHYLTDWKIEPSLKYDAICLLNILTGDPFYLKYYQREYDEFSKKLSNPVKGALAHLQKAVRENNRLILSAFLSLYFSATDEETLEGLLKVLDDSEDMRQKLKATPYYSDVGWSLYESVRGDLKTIFEFLNEIQFESYWRKYIVPKAVERIKKINKELPKYNIVAEVEDHLGVELPSHSITVYLLYFTKPHGLKITGTRFLTDVDWPFAIVVRNAVHEMMHPPFELVKDEELRTTLSLLDKDIFLMDKIRNHDPAYGYNSFEGFIEEDCVQALEQIINERMGIAVDPRRRWREADGGMHVFAVALYSVMKEESFNKKGESFRDFLVRMIRSEKLAPGKIKPIYDRFYE